MRPLESTGFLLFWTVWCTYIKNAFCIFGLAPCTKTSAIALFCSVSPAPPNLLKSDACALFPAFATCLPIHLLKNEGTDCKANTKKQYDTQLCVRVCARDYCKVSDRKVVFLWHTRKETGSCRVLWRTPKSLSGVYRRAQLNWMAKDKCAVYFWQTNKARLVRDFSLLTWAIKQSAAALVRFRVLIVIETCHGNIRGHGGSWSRLLLKGLID